MGAGRAGRAEEQLAQTTRDGRGREVRWGLQEFDLEWRQRLGVVFHRC